MTDKNLVVVDLDSTLHEYMHTVALVALNEFGVRLEGPAEDWNSVFPIGFERDRQVEIFQRCHDREYIFLTNPYPLAVESLKRIHRAGFDIWYLSDRKGSAEKDTIEWLSLHGFPDGKLTCSPDKRGELLSHKDNLATVIDDRPRTLIFALHELGLDNVFSLRHEYNKNLTDIPGIHIFDTWKEICDKFMEVV
jgi:phosphoglycolate phosphatase-like HAD superfamily hydrolase